MSAKDDLAFVEFHREEACTNGMSSCSYSAFVRLLALADRGARFTKEHEAVIEAALAFSHEEKCDNCCQDWPPGTKCAGCALESAKRALNEQREKEGER